MPRKTTTTSEHSAGQVIQTLDDIRLTMNDVKFNMRLMASIRRRCSGRSSAGSTTWKIRRRSASATLPIR